MAVNPDPKPGRWILPLVVLGMIAFTYFFVSELDGASPDTTLATGQQPTTSNGGGGGTGDGVGTGDGTTSTTGSQSQLDANTQTYLDGVDAINSDLQVQRTDLVTTNDAFNEDPRAIEFDEALSRFQAVESATQDLVTRHEDLTPPEALASNHQTLLTAIQLASDSITEAIAGLRSTDTGERRNAAINAYTTAASDYDTEVTNTHNAAQSASGG
jgi:hypothetical protein